MTERVQF